MLNSLDEGVQQVSHFLLIGLRRLILAETRNLLQGFIAGVRLKVQPHPPALFNERLCFPLLYHCIRGFGLYLKQLLFLRRSILLGSSRL